MADIHGCQVVYHFLKQYLVDLDRGSIYQDLIDDARSLWLQDHRGHVSRTKYCVLVVLNRLKAYRMREAPRPLDDDDFSDAIMHVDYELAEKAALATAKFYGIEVAEFSMGTEQRDARQIINDDNQKQLRQVRCALRLIAAAKAEDTQEVGRSFYEFMSRDLADLDMLLTAAKTLSGVRDVEQT